MCDDLVVPDGRERGAPEQPPVHAEPGFAESARHVACRGARKSKGSKGSKDTKVIGPSHVAFEGHLQ